MDKELQSIFDLVKLKHPHLLDNNTKIVDYCFWDASLNKELVGGFESVKTYKLAHQKSEIVLVIFFSDNTIGYRLNL